MKDLNQLILITALASPMFGCGESIDSDLAIAKVESVGGLHRFQVSVAEVQPGWGRIRAVGAPDNRKPMAITGCIGFLPACEAGVARPFIMYADPEVIQNSDASARQIVQGRVDPRGSILEFPYPVNFKQGIIFNLTTYYAKVRIVNGWVTLPSSSTDSAKPAPKTAAEEQQLRMQTMQADLLRLKQIPANQKQIESFRISEDWETQAFANMASELNKQLQQLGQMNMQPSSPPISQNNNSLQPPQSQPNQNPGIPNNSSQGAGDLVSEDILNQGATNYCWGYSAFHMVRQYYYSTDKNGAWAQAISKINTTEGMASYMRQNHTNQGNNMMTWIRKFLSNNPGLPNDGWGHNGSISTAAQKLQQNPAIPSSYCDGRHCTALIGFSGGQFTVADSSGGYTYRAGQNEIGDYDTVSLSSSGSTQSSNTSPSMFANQNSFSNGAMGNPFAQSPGTVNWFNPFSYGLK